MTWIKLEDSFTSNPKIAMLPDSAFRLYVTSLCYAGKHLTDGFIPAPLRRSLGTEMASKATRKLLEKGLWIKVEGGYEINDYLKYQTSKEQAEMDKENNRLRVERARKAKTQAIRNGVTNGVRTGGVTVTHTPTPTHTPTDNKKKKISVNKVDHDQEFFTFWLMYPRKVGKLAAQKAFDRALKSATPQEIFEGVTRYLRDCGSDPKFITHPSTWLNQGRWMDVAHSNPKPKVEGSHSQSSNRFEVSEQTPQPPKFSIGDVNAPTKPAKSWRELVEEAK